MEIHWPRWFWDVFFQTKILNDFDYFLNSLFIILFSFKKFIIFTFSLIGQGSLKSIKKCVVAKSTKIGPGIYFSVAVREFYLRKVPILTLCSPLHRAGPRQIKSNYYVVRSFSWYWKNKYELCGQSNSCVGTVNERLWLRSFSYGYII